MSVAAHAVSRFWRSAYAGTDGSARRHYPNEELVRFLAANFGAIAPSARATLPILEVGCGSGANLWMIADEGFAAHGLDLAPEALALCRDTFARRRVDGMLACGTMASLPYAADSFAAVVDVFASYCLVDAEFGHFLAEAVRVLRPGALLFLYHPSTRSDAFTDFAPSRKLDTCTLDGIARADAPFAGNDHPFHFVDPDDIATRLAGAGLVTERCETVARTYNQRGEGFEFVVATARKPARRATSREV